MFSASEKEALCGIVQRTFFYFMNMNESGVDNLNGLGKQLNLKKQGDCALLLAGCMRLEPNKLFLKATDLLTGLSTPTYIRELIVIARFRVFQRLQVFLASEFPDLLNNSESIDPDVLESIHYNIYLSFREEFGGLLEPIVSRAVLEAALTSEGSSENFIDFDSLFS